MVRWFTNRIPNPAGYGEKPDFAKWFNETLSKKAAKVTEAKVEQEDEPTANINNDNKPEAHSYQEGESVDGKKPEDGGAGKSNSGGKSKGKGMGDCNDAGKVTEKHSPACACDTGDKVLINNDPNYQKGESVDGKKDTKAAVAKAVKTSVASKKMKKVAMKPINRMSREDRIKLLAVLAAQPIGNLKYNPLHYAEHMTSVKFANLDKKTKKWLTDYWTVLFPAEYVAQMVADR